MKDSALQNLIEEAVMLDRHVRAATERLKEIKAALVLEAAGRPDDHQTTDGNGTSWAFTGAHGSLARVTFPSAQLKSKIDPETKPGQRLLEKLGRFKDELLKPCLSYVPVTNFRERARELLGKQAAGAIKAAESESTPRVSFETKESAS